MHSQQNKYLHQNKDDFNSLINQIHNQNPNLDKEKIEKDYYICLILKKIFEKQPNIVFKGGTSLSKCHKLIDRFSEDIDLSFRDVEKDCTLSKKRQINYNIVPKLRNKVQV